MAFKESWSDCCHFFFSNLLGFWYQKKACIFLIFSNIMEILVLEVDSYLEDYYHCFLKFLQINKIHICMFFTLGNVWKGDNICQFKKNHFPMILWQTPVSLHSKQLDQFSWNLKLIYLGWWHIIWMKNSILRIEPCIFYCLICLSVCIGRGFTCGWWGWAGWLWVYHTVQARSQGVRRTTTNLPKGPFFATKRAKNGVLWGG